MNMQESFPESRLPPTLKPLEGGSQIMAVSILLPVLAVLLLVGVLISSLLMTLTPSRTRFRLLYWTVITSGILLALVSVFSLVAR